MSEADTNGARTLTDVSGDLYLAQEDLRSCIDLADHARIDDRLDDCERWLSDGREKIVRIRTLRTERKLIEARTEA